VMVKEQGKGIVLSLADPDLRLPKRRNLAYLDAEADATTARPSCVRIELRGGWRLRTPCAEVVCARRGSVTELTMSCANGLTVEVALEPEEG